VLIDFQGMRWGSPFYDLGSLLYDPYVFFTAEERLELLSYYYVLSNRALDWKGFRKAFYEASAQRLMQALGAYGFLGMKRGLSDFLGYSSPGAGESYRCGGQGERSFPTPGTGAEVQGKVPSLASC